MQQSANRGWPGRPSRQPQLAHVNPILKTDAPNRLQHGSVLPFAQGFPCFRSFSRFKRLHQAIFSTPCWALDCAPSFLRMAVQSLIAIYLNRNLTFPFHVPGQLSQVHGTTVQFLNAIDFGPSTFSQLIQNTSTPYSILLPNLHTTTQVDISQAHLALGSISFPNSAGCFVPVVFPPGACQPPLSKARSG